MVSRFKTLFGDPLQDISLVERAKVLRQVLNIAIPMIFIFGLFNYTQGFHVLAWVQLGLLLFMMVPARLLVNNLHYVQVAEWLALLSTASILLLLLYAGGIADLGFVWAWLFPFIAFYFAGIRKGWYWSAAFLMAASVIFMNGWGITSSYDADTKLLFFMAYVFYMVLGYRFNEIRFQYLFDLEDKVEARTVELKHISLHDTLTDLPNRLHINQFLQTLIDKGKDDFIVLNLDIARFNEVNNVLGYENGDQLLKLFAQRIQAIGNDGVFVGRFGADEFAIIVQHVAGHDIHASEATVLAYVEGMLQQLERPYTIDQSEVELEMVVGIELANRRHTKASHMIRRANFACHMAKQTQNKIALYDSVQDETISKQFHVFGGLRKAIQNHELVLFYQPKIDIAQKKVTDVEALIRWISPEDGMIPPNDFIPVAESTGLIHPVTRFVIDEAMHQQCVWRDHGYHINIAINISVRNLMDDTLIPFIQSCLTKHHMKPEFFTLEVTESAIMSQAEKALQTIDTLKTMGFSISLDDYGTGYTSLSYLKEMPVDELKIDQSFIFSYLESDRDRAIVQSTVALVENLGLKVVAEGIENQAVLTCLADMGCDKGQGYFIARPMPAKDFSLWLESSDWSFDS